MGASLVLAFAACSHSEPFTFENDVDLPPADDGLPLRLTFNPGGDAYPFVRGDSIYYSRRQLVSRDRDWCIAVLPLNGGTVAREHCPDGGSDNGIKESWLQPTVSPDGSRMVFEETVNDTNLTRLVPRRRRLMISPIDAPDQATEVLDVTTGLFSVDGPFANPIRANRIHQIRWLDDKTVRYIAGEQKNLIGQNCCDTLYVPMALIDVDVDSRTWSRVELGDLPPKHWVPGPNGEIYFTEADDPEYDRPFIECANDSPVCPMLDIRKMSGSGPPSIFLDFGLGLGQITSLYGEVGHMFASYAGNLLWVDQNNGATAILNGLLPAFTFEVPSLYPADDGRVVVEISASPGQASNLWLIQTGL